MRQKTNLVITITIAILIAMVFFIRGKPTQYPDTIATEQVPEDESLHVEKALHLFREKLLQGDGKAALVRRGAHPKHHGCVKAKFQVVSNLEPHLHTELFKPGVVYPAWVRFSNNDDPKPDTTPDVRGFAIKLFNVPGPKFTGDDYTHDLLLVSHPVFLFPDVETYVSAFEAFEKNQPLRFFFNPFNLQIGAFRIAKDMLQEHRNLLAMRWWSMVPYKYGDKDAVKYSARPCANSAAKKRNYGQGIGADFLKDRLSESLSAESACYEFMVQFQNDPRTMPIEDPTVEWDETINPFQPIARLTIPAQQFDTAEQSAFCENLSFNPWRALSQHQPLGGINRARREIYTQLVKFRRERNQAPSLEPPAPSLVEKI
ncbi:MAG: catalase family protein [Gammaproteobacteria bacterium]